jgi:hypothetical protein
MKNEGGENVEFAGQGFAVSRVVEDLHLHDGADVKLQLVGIRRQRICVPRGPLRRSPTPS